MKAIAFKVHYVPSFKLRSLKQPHSKVSGCMETMLSSDLPLTFTGQSPATGVLHNTCALPGKIFENSNVSPRLMPTIEWDDSMNSPEAPKKIKRK